MISKALSTEEKDSLLKVLKTRFEKNMGRHPGIKWEDVQVRLENNPEKLWSLEGEPDVVDFDEKSGEFIFYDCSPESPKGRRSLCYDRAALDARKEYKPANSIMDMAADMGVEVLTEEQYRFLQTLGNFDLKTSSWIITPPEIRKRGGALFGDRRYDHVFTYHNGADSYYAARGFRSALKV